MTTIAPAFHSSMRWTSYAAKQFLDGFEVEITGDDIFRARNPKRFKFFLLNFINTSPLRNSGIITLDFTVSAGAVAWLLLPSAPYGLWRLNFLWRRRSV